MVVHAKIDEADVARVKLGQPVTFEVDALAPRVFSGEVAQVRKSAELVQNVVSYTAVISAPNPDQVLLPGLTANIRILIDQTSETLMVPNEALRFRPKDRPKVASASNESDGSATVWILGKDGTPSPVNIRIGQSDNEGTQVLSGPLIDGHQVIVGVAQQGGPVGSSGLRLGFQ